MALIQATRQSAGGGGGLTITGFEVEQFNQATNFTPGSVNLSLAQIPVSEDAITIDWNGARLLKGSAWQYNSVTNEVEILFGDAYVTTYDTVPYFQVCYPY